MVTLPPNTTALSLFRWLPGETINCALGWIVMQGVIRHGSAVSSLPMHHSDPFDRMLIAQALCENLRIITRDRKFEKYQVEVLRA